MALINKILNRYYKYFGSRRYRKFVIIARSRTGSNLLNSYLNNSSQIIARGELFGRIGDKDEKRIWTDIYRKYSSLVCWVGFKLFYQHPVDSDSKFVWNQIKKDQSILIIHLTRDNKVRAELSRLIAFKTKKWAANTSKPNFEKAILEDKKIKLDVDSFLDEIQSVVNYENYIRQEYSNHKIIEITYEQLTKNPNKTIGEIRKEFDIDSFKIKTPLAKQNTESIEDLVINFEELEKKLSGTQFYSNLSEL